MSIVRENLLKDKNYVPYCGNIKCPSSPRVIKISILVFECSVCGWKSSYDHDFIKQYIEIHGVD